jgi:hypothetical protein
MEPKKGSKWPKKLPRFENRQDAMVVCKELCKLQFILRCEKRGKGELGVSSNCSFCDVVVRDLLLMFYLDDTNA